MLRFESYIIIKYYYIFYISIHLYLSFWRATHLIFLFKTVGKNYKGINIRYEKQHAIGIIQMDKCLSWVRFQSSHRQYQGHCYGIGLIPGTRTSTHHGCCQNKHKRKEIVFLGFHQL